MLTKLHLENFTVFRKADFEFVPGINVLVGANASGKTHLLKVLYAMQQSQRETDAERALSDHLLDVFRPEKPSDLVRYKATPRHAAGTAWWGDAPLKFKIAASPDRADFDDEQAAWKGVSEPVFVPVKDMLAHSVGFLSLYASRNIDFDVTYRDILLRAGIPTLRGELRARVEPLLKNLETVLNGRVEQQGERFYLSGQTGRFEMHMIAEGWRKIALLYQLIANGSLGDDTVLYWDEPETNLNPSLMDELIGIFYELTRRGTQIFLATHNYIILKELELQKKTGDTLRMFAMARNETDGTVKPHAASTYSELRPNLIADQFERIYDFEISRALGGEQ